MFLCIGQCPGWAGAKHLFAEVFGVGWGEDGANPWKSRPPSDTRRPATPTRRNHPNKPTSTTMPNPGQAARKIEARRRLGDVHAGYHTTVQHVNDIAAQQF